MRRSRTLPRAIVVAGLALALAGCGGPAGSGTVGPQRPAARPQLPRRSSSGPHRRIRSSGPSPPGWSPSRKEYTTNHVHAHVDVFVDGKPITIPAGIGIDIDDPDVRTLRRA